jgi:RND superfamily putative drug exporter
LLGALGNFSARHHWWIIAAWIMLMAGGGGVALINGAAFTNDMTLAGTDSQHAYDTLRTQFPEMSGDGMQVVLHSNRGLESAELKNAVEASISQVRKSAGITAVQSPYGPGPHMVSTDGKTAIVTVQFVHRAKDISQQSLDHAQQGFKPIRDLGVEVEFGGPAVQTESGPSGSEVFGLGAAVLVLLVAFGSLFAMVVPLVTAVFALTLGLSLVELLSSWVTIGTTGPVVAAMIGLGVGIDYALLIVTRHREGLASGYGPNDSIRIAMTTAGRAVFVAGATVVIAILSLYLIGIPFISGMALASSITVAVTLLASVTLLPALLGLFGGRLDRFRIRRIRFNGGSDRQSGWHRWAAKLLRRRWVALPFAVMILVALAAPVLSMQLGSAAGGSAPADSTVRREYELVAEGFGPGWTGPLLITASYPPGTPQSEVQKTSMALRNQLAATPGVSQVTPPRLNAMGNTVLLTVIPTSAPDARATEDLVHRLRNGILPTAAPNAKAHVGGATATNIDLANTISHRMPWFILGVVGLTFLLLLVEFRSLLVPLVAVTMNLLAVGAAYGPIVAVFQWGWWPASALGIQPGPVESFAPVMLFAVLFGISTDYAVFLLSRIHEEYRRTGKSRQAIVEGVGGTAHVILAAASVMVVVFSSFMLNDQRVVNLFGFGLAVAVAFYAILVMFALVPVVLALIGRKAWWLPRWLGRLLPMSDHPEPVDP